MCKVGLEITRGELLLKGPGRMGLRRQRETEACRGVLTVSGEGKGLRAKGTRRKENGKARFESGVASADGESDRVEVKWSRGGEKG